MTNSATKQKAFIVTNIDLFFLTNRKEQARKMMEAGYEVHVLAADTGRKDEIIAEGFIFHELSTSRFGSNILKELRSIYQIYRIYKETRPQIIHHLGMKPLVMGSLAGAFIPGCVIYNTYTGLGYPFMTDTFKTRIMRGFIYAYLKLLHKKKSVIAIFQNTTDCNLFLKKKIIPRHQAFVIKGCGVDISKFTYKRPEEKTHLKILLPGKMLTSKGVVEFIKVAETIGRVYKDKTLEFILCGGLDKGHPFSVDLTMLEEANSRGVVNWIGNQSNMPEVFSSSDIIIFPSIREGLPKALLEASAIGRPIIAYDVAGSNEVVKDGYNGYLVPLKDVDGLINATKKLIEDDQQRVLMGYNGYQRARDIFALDIVIDENLALYRKFARNNNQLFK